MLLMSVSCKANKIEEALLMDMNDTFHAAYMDLIRWIDDILHEVDNRIVMDLLDSDEEYAVMQEKIIDYQEKYPYIAKLMDGDKEISLTAEEHKMFLEYHDLYQEIENVEWQQIYFHGHTYLNRIGVI